MLTVNTVKDIIIGVGSILLLLLILNNLINRARRKRDAGLNLLRVFRYSLRGYTATDLKKLMLENYKQKLYYIVADEFIRRGYTVEEMISIHKGIEDAKNLDKKVV